MSVEENRVMVRNLYSLLNKANLTAAFQLFSIDYIEHSSDRDINLEQLIQSTEYFFNSFLNIKINVEEMVAEGDRIAVRETWTATHKGGEFMHITPTGKKVKITNTCIFRINNNRLAECWATLDSLNLLQQLGVIPTK